ncbi:MAG TPA: Uma2 family endonuclease [Bacteroidetes bacterium]|nr:Uma2 family endonuclease [Bacteroidota bacterium]
MPATAVQQQPARPLRKQKKTRRISWETFQKKYLTREDGYKYEWLNGTVEKTPYTMDKTQIYIQRNLLACFRKLLNEGKVKGELIAEPDLFFLKNHRRPDMCWLTDGQIDRLAEDDYEVPAFVIEVISKNDVISKMEDKMEDYRAAGVQVVWKIYPQHQKIHVHTGENLETITVFRGAKICSAAPVLPGFTVAAEDVFGKATADK